MRSILEFSRRWWLTIIVTAAILWLTLAPHPVGDNEIELFPGADKIIHAIMMGGLAFTALFDFARNGTWRNIRKITPAIAITVAFTCIIFSCIDEWGQSVMNLGRSSDPFDLVADIAGIILAATIAVPLIRKLLPREK